MSVARVVNEDAELWSAGELSVSDLDIEAVSSCSVLAGLTGREPGIVSRVVPITPDPEIDEIPLIGAPLSAARDPGDASFKMSLI